MIVKCNSTLSLTCFHFWLRNNKISRKIWIIYKISQTCCFFLPSHVHDVQSTKCTMEIFRLLQGSWFASTRFLGRRFMNYESWREEWITMVSLKFVECDILDICPMWCTSEYPHCTVGTLQNICEKFLFVSLVHHANRQDTVHFSVH